MERFLSASDYISGDRFDVVRCLRCGAAITEAHDAAGYYDEGYYGQRKSFVEGAVNSFRVRKLSRMAGSDPRKELLDIGCGNGSFLMAARRDGWDAQGTEIAPSSHIMTGAGAFIRSGDFLRLEFPADRFDGVTLWHSLEHVTDPAGYIRKIGSVLKPGGFVMIEVPDIDSLQAEAFGENWFHLDVPRHLFHFSPESLKRLLEENRFTDISVRPGSFIYCYFGWLQSILNKVSRRKNLLFDLMNGKISAREAYAKHARDMMTTVACVPFAVVFAALFSVLGMCLGRSGVMLVSARKKS
ncbi:MAG: class I SAM-dependent methyltransferase [Patescibacteria group bacterium]|nr:class I SAM-dependent methyltransferase [Patescibacteria group bacterium]